MNARHEAAVAATNELVDVLRADIRAQLEELAKLDVLLLTMLDEPPTPGLGFLTEEMRTAMGKQVLADRAAARGIQPRHATPGLEWLNRDHRLGSGQVKVAVTMPAASASAQLRFGILQHIRRLTRAARLVALEAEQADAEDYGVCTWPRRPVARQQIHTDDGSLHVLTERLAVLVDGYTSRPGLEQILRDLDQLAEVARDVIDGPGRTNHPDACPWCGRKSLVILHRENGIRVQKIRCEGTHRCQCTNEWCPCQRNPHKHRHDWVNSGRVANNWTQLARDQAHRKELMALETRALDLLAQIAALHTPHWTDTEGNRHTHYVLVDGHYVRDHLPDHQCIDIGPDRCEVYDDDPAGSVHSVLGCIECQITTEDGHDGYRIWPCPTARLTDPTRPPTTEETSTDD